MLKRSSGRRELCTLSSAQLLVVYCEAVTYVDGWRFSAVVLVGLKTLNFGSAHFSFPTYKYIKRLLRAYALKPSNPTGPHFYVFPFFTGLLLMPYGLIYLARIVCIEHCLDANHGIEISLYARN